MNSPEHRFSIGRDRTCDLAIAHDTVSARHAEISFIGGGRVLLTDCKSSNGTWRRGPDGTDEPIRQELISPMDQVRFGDVRMSVREIIEALRLKFPQFDSAPPTPPRPPAPRNLERCECGCVKPAGKPCPECGQ